MRCPYCGGSNPENTTYCIRCGRVLGPSSARYPLPRQAPPAPQVPSRQPVQAPPPRTQRNYPNPPVAPTTNRPVAPPVMPAPPPAPEPPAPFPSRNLAQLKALLPGALPYTLIESAATYGRKKVVRISYAACAPWQQVATLYKALQEQQDARSETIVIQGFHEQDVGAYMFSNGQLTFDRNTRLGGQTVNRYVVETGNGFAIDSVRIVLTEEQNG